MQRNAIFLDEQNILQGFSSPPAGKSFSESSETFLPSGKYFPNLRKPSRRQEIVFRLKRISYRKTGCMVFAANLIIF